MADNTEQIRFLWDLIEEASERRDALSESTDFQQDRIDWEASARARLEQVFGKGDVAGGFGGVPGPVGLDQTTTQYDADIRYLQAVRKSLGKSR